MKPFMSYCLVRLVLSEIFLSILSIQNLISPLYRRLYEIFPVAQLFQNAGLFELPLITLEGPVNRFVAFYINYQHCY